jgi:hypothetical protein
MIGLTVCVNYADFLAETLPQNRKFFTHFYVVTEESDAQTVELGKQHDCTLLFTTKTHERGSKFNRSGLLYDAQKLIHRKHPEDWICILDSDILLPDSFSALDEQTLLKNNIYGVPRHVYATKADYLANQNAVVEVRENEVIGYFQLYWLKFRYYEPWSADCSKSDMTFMRLFKRRLYLRDLHCVHFGLTGVNWEGRVSEKWTENP